MTERQIQFRVGLFAVVAVVLAGAMVFKFGELQSLWEPRYAIAIHFRAAPGVYPSTPVRKNGVPIGTVREVNFDSKRGGVNVIVEIHDQYRLRADAEPRLVRSLLGDATIEFTPGVSRKVLQPGSRVEGIAPPGAMQVVNRLEGKLTETLDSLNSSSREWGELAEGLNGLLETNRGDLDTIVERTAESLHQFTLTMRNANETLGHANQIVGDPDNQENLRKTLAALPKMVDETRRTIAAVKMVAEKADGNLSNLEEVTGPMAERSASIVTRLDGTLGNLESLSAEMNQFAQAVNDNEGSIKKLAADPELYRNLNRSAASLSVLLKNLQPVVRDLRVFSDKVARHPELIGVGGALKGSSGLKEPPPEEKTAPRRANRPRGRSIRR